MNLKKYFKDRLYSIFLVITGLIIGISVLMAFKTQTEAVGAIAAIFIMIYAMDFFTDFFRKKKFYDGLNENLSGLDQKYFVTETVRKPEFYEGEILFNALSQVDSSMIENIKKYRMKMDDFKEYVEMWIHEIKLPISSLTLMIHNYKNNHMNKCNYQNYYCNGSDTPDNIFVSTEDNDISDNDIPDNALQENDIMTRMSFQVERINNYIEQILYYVRSENAEKDYIINDCVLSKIVSQAALKNKDDLLENNVNFIVDGLNVTVLTDSKWLLFILNQIINNSIKYSDESKGERMIKIYAAEDRKSTMLCIYDNGIGISKSDLPKVFDKSFTGKNGRSHAKATGMGLYIAKKLCDKLGHNIAIQSEEGEYTQVNIEFFKNDFYREITNVTKL